MPSAPGNVGRGLLLAAGAAALVSLWLTFGTDSLPFAASSLPMDGGGSVPIHLRSGVDSSYFRIQDDGYVVGLVCRPRFGGHHYQGCGHEYLCPIHDARISRSSICRLTTI